MSLSQISAFQWLYWEYLLSLVYILWPNGPLGSCHCSWFKTAISGVYCREIVLHCCLLGEILGAWPSHDKASRVSYRLIGDLVWLTWCRELGEREWWQWTWRIKSTYFKIMTRFGKKYFRRGKGKYIMDWSITPCLCNTACIVKSILL